MKTYQTQSLTKREAKIFNLLFDDLIGTETETDIHGQDYYVTCYELLDSEIAACIDCERKAKA